MTENHISETHRICLVRAGSHAYGLNREGSDEDFRGVFVAPPAEVIGLNPVDFHAVSADFTYFEVRKFLKLCRDCNPNIIELLFSDGPNLLETSPYWERIRSHRDIFVTKVARKTFSGYAMDQLRKIRSHYKYVNDPQPVAEPEPSRYMKTKYIEGLGHKEVFDQTAYDDARRTWRQYWEWKRKRNPDRAVLEVKFGYDTKHAMHLIRLLRMGGEILRGEGVLVLRPDREELLAIRSGALTYDDLETEAARLEARLELDLENSPLPEGPDDGLIEELLLETYRAYWRDHGLW